MARPRSNTWLWVLNAVVIGFVVVTVAAAATRVGHTAVSATYHFLLYYVGVLALIALTAEVGIGLVATDRIFMKPSGRVTMQAIHRAVGFGAIAFLLVHIGLEILAGRATAADAVIPFLYKHKTFYLGIGTVASDMFIVVMMLGIYRARLATRMSPRGWRVLHATAYLAWVFGIIHGLLGGRPAKSFFGYAGFVYWCYGACVAAVALALLVRFVAKDRAGNEMAGQPVAQSPSGAGWPAAALATGALPGSMLPAAALPGGPQPTLEGWPPAHRQAGLGQRGRSQLALPAGASGAASGGSYLSAPLGQFSSDHPSGPFDRPPFDRAQFDRAQFDRAQFGASQPGGSQPGGYRPGGSRPGWSQSGGSQPGAQAGGQRAGGAAAPGRSPRSFGPGQSDWIAAYERPMGVQRPVLPADHPSGPFTRPQFDQPGSGQPGFDQPGFDQPGFDRPGFGRPGFEQPGPGRPGSEQPGPGQPPRYERTGEIDLSGSYGTVLPKPVLPEPVLPEPMRSGPVLPADHPSAPFERPRFDQPMDYARPDPSTQPWPPAGAGWPEPVSQSGRPDERQMAPGYAGPGRAGTAGHYSPREYPGPRYGAQAGPAGGYPPDGGTGGTGQHSAPYPPAAYPPAPDPPARTAPYAPFGDQDAVYTPPRAPGWDHAYAPQEDTDPMGFAPLDPGDQP